MTPSTASAVYLLVAIASWAAARGHLAGADCAVQPGLDAVLGAATAGGTLVELVEVADVEVGATGCGRRWRHPAPRALGGPARPMSCLRG